IIVQETRPEVFDNVAGFGLDAIPERRGFTTSQLEFRVEATDPEAAEAYPNDECGSDGPRARNPGKTVRGQGGSLHLRDGTPHWIFCDWNHTRRGNVGDVPNLGVER